MFVTDILMQHDINNPSGYWSSRKYSTYRARVKVHCLNNKIGMCITKYTYVLSAGLISMAAVFFLFSDSSALSSVELSPPRLDLVLDNV